MSKGPQRIRGTQDIFGEEADRFHAVVDAFDRVRRLYALPAASRCRCSRRPRCSRARSARPPTSSRRRCTRSRTAAAIRSRCAPNSPPGICRAYLTEGWQQHAPLKLATHGPLFRYERPQKGRFRQFHQLDAEIIGAAEPAADVELLVLADQLLQRAGHRRRRDAAAQHAGRCRDAATPGARRWSRISRRIAATLSEDSLDRLDKNPLRILDSKDPRDRPIADGAPRIDDFLTGEAGDFFARGHRRARCRGRRLDAQRRGWCAGSIITATPRSSSSPTGSARRARCSPAGAMTG